MLYAYLTSGFGSCLNVSGLYIVGGGQCGTHLPSSMKLRQAYNETVQYRLQKLVNGIVAINGAVATYRCLFVGLYISIVMITITITRQQHKVLWHNDCPSHN